MKSVLVHINRDEGQEARLQAALDLLRTFGGHLTCLQVAPLEALASIDAYGAGYLLGEAVQQIREIEDEEKQKLETRLQNEGVSWDWVNEAGDAARSICNHSSLADIVVVSKPEAGKPSSLSSQVASDVVLRSRAPVLVVPEQSRGFDATLPAAVAWNGSAEAGIAIRDALPLLQRASTVSLLAVAEESEYDLPAIDASTYLARHGVISDLIELKTHGGPITDTLLDAASAQSAGCLVAGAYGHSRLQENILGGVTRGLLQKSTIPLLLAH